MKRKSFLWIAGIAALIFGLASCSNLVDIDSEKNNEAKNAILVLNVGNSSARTIFANDIPFADMTYTLKGTKSGGTEETLIDNSAYAVLSSPVNVQTGTWNFELIAKKSGKPVYSAVIEKKQISEGSNKLDFVLQEIAESSDGTGTAKVTISVPEDANVESIEVSVIDVKTLKTINEPTKLPLTQNTAVYEEKEISVGNYLLQFVFYDKDGNTINQYSEVVRIRDGRLSEKTIEITDFEKIHTITYYDGEYEISKDSISFLFQDDIPFSFIEQQKVYLPGGAAIKKEGYIFLGWCEDKECNGEPMTVFSANTNKDLVLYAKWQADSAETNGVYGNTVYLPKSTEETYTLNKTLASELKSEKIYKIVLEYNASKRFESGSENCEYSVNFVKKAGEEYNLLEEDELIPFSGHESSSSDGELSFSGLYFYECETATELTLKITGTNCIVGISKFTCTEISRIEYLRNIRVVGTNNGWEYKKGVAEGDSWKFGPFTNENAVVWNLRGAKEYFEGYTANIQLDSTSAGTVSSPVKMEKGLEGTITGMKTYSTFYIIINMETLTAKVEIVEEGSGFSFPDGRVLVGSFNCWYPPAGYELVDEEEEGFYSAKIIADASTIYFCYTCWDKDEKGEIVWIDQIDGRGLVPGSTSSGLHLYAEDNSFGGGNICCDKVKPGYYYTISAKGNSDGTVLVNIKEGEKAIKDLEDYTLTIIGNNDAEIMSESFTNGVLEKACFEDEEAGECNIVLWTTYSFTFDASSIKTIKIVNSSNNKYFSDSINLGDRANLECSQTEGTISVSNADTLGTYILTINANAEDENIGLVLNKANWYYFDIPNPSYYCNYIINNSIEENQSANMHLFSNDINSGVVYLTGALNWSPLYIFSGDSKPSCVKQDNVVRIYYCSVSSCFNLYYWSSDENAPLTWPGTQMFTVEP